MSNERMNRIGRKLSATGAAIACAGALAGSLENPASAEPVFVDGALDCTQFLNTNDLGNGRYRACFDYIVDSAESSLQGYYKFGNSKVNYIRDAAKHHLESRYFLGSRAVAERRVSGWPKGVNTVHEKVDLVSISANTLAERALIRTREQWDIVDSQGDHIFRQASHVEGHTLCHARLPGYVDASWLVVKNTVDPRFNCLSFADKLASGQIQ